jgi:hypothetical protein
MLQQFRAKEHNTTIASCTLVFTDIIVCSNDIETNALSRVPDFSSARIGSTMFTTSSHFPSPRPIRMGRGGGQCGTRMWTSED